MAKKPILTIEEVRQLLRYDPDTGDLFWLPRPPAMFVSDAACKTWNTRFAGKKAFTASSHGYRLGAINYRNYPAHRVAYAIYHGRWPSCMIDHINGERSDNRISNLREASHSENQMNRHSVVSKSGFKGVTFDKKKGRFLAQIQKDGVNHAIGMFDSPVEAAAAYNNAASTMFGDFARLNQI